MATNRICSIPNCFNRYAARGYCFKHYMRLRNHGDPLGGGTEKGEARKFYDDVVRNYDGNDCLIWPYARNPQGYAPITIDGKTREISRLLCEEANGPPPTPKHEAAHSCGNGRLGCVTKKHLSWKTRTENQADRLVHGTHSRGERHGSAKITEEQVHEIRSLKGHMTQQKIADRFGISCTNVRKILSGNGWSWL